MLNSAAEGEETDLRHLEVALNKMT